MVAARQFRFAILILLVAPPHANAGSAAPTELVLSHWGFSRIEEIGYVSLGVLKKPEGETLVVYDVRARKPQVPPAPPGPRGRVPSFSGDTFLVSHFNAGNTNRLGGYFSTFAKAPARASISIARAPDGTPSLAFSYDRQPPAFAGFWIHLFNMRAMPADRVFLDSTPFPHLTFSVRGERGGESLRLQLADRAWEGKEDSLPVADVGSFLTGGRVEARWQTAWIPLDRLPLGIERRELASIVFQVSGSGSGSVYLKDLAFTVRKDAAIPPPVTSPVPLRRLAKGMWLWKTPEIATDVAARARLIAFCRREGVTDLFLQIPYEAERQSGAWVIRWDSSPMPRLIAALADAGVKVHALDGHPRYALRENHGRELALVDRIVSYNAGVSARERFAGIHYDTEPYLLPEFAGRRKEAVLVQYLALLEATRERTRKGGLDFGVDIPFWFDARNENFEPTAAVGGRPMSERIIDLADHVVLMDYRTVAYGADGVIEHASAELDYAARQGKRVLVGLETVELPDETIYQLEAAGGTGSRLVLTPAAGGKARVHWIRGNAPLPESLSRPRVTLAETRSTFVPASKITFARMRPADLDRVMREAERELLRFPSFHGFAIHSYESFWRWTDAHRAKEY